MRLIQLIPWVLLCGILSLSAGTAQAESVRTPGQIRAARVQGSVIATNLLDQTQVTLKDGSVISQNYVVTTGVGSGVVLLLSNGAALNLGPESTLSIDEFLQDPFSDDIALADLKEEPTTSVTRLNLARGELVGTVKKIKTEAGSSFTVNTPVGAAGIRGTTFRIVFRPTASGRVFFTLSTSEGRVLYEAPISRTIAAVPTGQEIVVALDVQVNPTTGTVSVVAPPIVGSTQPIPAATQAAIAVASQQIVQAAAGVILSSTRQADQAADEKAAAEKAAAEKAAAEKAAQEKAEQEKTAQEKAEQDESAEQKSGSNNPDDAPAQPQSDQPGEQQQIQQQASRSAPPPPTSPSSNTTPGDGR